MVVVTFHGLTIYLRESLNFRLVQIICSHSRLIDGGDFALKDRFPRIFSISTQTPYSIDNMGIWDGDTWLWDLIWRRRLYQQKVAQCEELSSIQDISNPIQGKKYKLILSQSSKDGSYTVKEFLDKANKALYQRSSPKSIVDIISQRKPYPIAELVV